jgi:hypothetical protein
MKKYKKELILMRHQLTKTEILSSQQSPKNQEIFWKGNKLSSHSALYNVQQVSHY